MSEQISGNEPQALRAGITGGIGSGKTTVCRLFETLGIPVYYADYWAKWLLENDTELVAGVKKEFGEEAYLDGRYNRPFIANIVFSNPEKLAALNALSHPALEKHSRQWHDEQSNVPYTLKEAAVMIESGSHRFLDVLIVVTAPEALRVERVMQRDGVAAEVVSKRMANQLPESEKIKLADFVIDNDGVHALIPQVWAIHQAICSGKGS